LPEDLWEEGLAANEAEGAERTIEILSFVYDLRLCSDVGTFILIRHKPGLPVPVRIARRHQVVIWRIKIG
jgi:hypothetical protein